MSKPTQYDKDRREAAKKNYLDNYEGRFFQIADVYKLFEDGSDWSRLHHATKVRNILRSGQPVEQMTIEIDKVFYT